MKTIDIKTHSPQILRRNLNKRIPLQLGFLLTVPTLLYSQATITFEEFTPQIITNQYCNNVPTNKGVNFLSGVRIDVAAVNTSSGAQALLELDNGDDTNPQEGPIIISFTTGQSFVGFRVGLNYDREAPVNVVLRAYDHPELGQGNKLTPTPDPSINLGTGPTNITQTLSFGAANGPANIRRIEVEGFVANNYSAVQEAIDDLHFSSAGPLCLLNDNQPPTAGILKPEPNQILNTPQSLLYFQASDAESGIKSVQLIFLDAANNELQSYFYCDSENSLCPGYPNSNEVEAQYYSIIPRDTRSIYLAVTDWAGNVGWDQVFFNLVLPEPGYNIWALGMEVTQVLQNQVPTSTASRSNTAPQANLNFGPNLVAGKRTIVRLYPGVEGTTVPVVGARASLSCFKTLGATPGSGVRCDGPLGADAVNPELTIDPANDNDLRTMRLNSSLSWNFILPPEWTTPGEIRWLVAKVRPPLYVPECDDCDDGANYFILSIPAFQETAPLIIKPRIACVRRSSQEAKEACIDNDPTGRLATNVVDAMAIFQQFLWGEDWDNDGILDPFFNVVMPVADRSNGIHIKDPFLYDFRDGDLSSPKGTMRQEQVDEYLFYLNDVFGLDWSDIYDPEFTVAYPKNWRQLAFVPPPMGPGGKADYSRPSAVVKIDLKPSRISGNSDDDGDTVRENDFCTDCPNDPKSTIHWDEPNVAHEIGHTFEIKHASCDHNENPGGGCDSAPSVFPCPHGGTCLSAAELDEPVGFNTYNFAVIPPRNAAMHAHDFMSYGSGPTWISRHTYTRLFQKLRAQLSEFVF